ncbi:MAG: hypothetical protein KAU35_03520 [candidate division Zixibacteria bacterium]|jgi:arsenate reductase-like glutaredoxin family protein|nr:hypothetical protein [candidate division Zixibacteria bacterium]
MAPKRALLYYYGNDDVSTEIKKLIEDAGVILEIRDMDENPLNEEELEQLFGHLEISHFINTLSDAYTKFHLDKNLPDRQQVISLMAKDHTLIRRPIVKSSRLVTVGSDHRRIAEMLQISADGQSTRVIEVPNHYNRTPSRAKRVPRSSKK